MMKSLTIQRTFFLLVLCAAVFLAECGQTEPWRTYRYDNARSGYTPENLNSDLHLQWSFQPAHAPKPAWPAPAAELPRMHEDNAFHAVIADQTVFFGSSITDRIMAIDAASGDVRWTFQTEGPVRFAPTYHQGRILAGADDGCVYCLNAADGALIWKYRPGLSLEKVLGNGRMISMWPIRTNVLVDRETAYFAAGVFPYEGLYVCALDVKDGRLIWKNDTVGDYAHELEYGGISPHGYLLASDDILFVPSGRAMPAAFDRKDGEFLYYASPGAKRGGTWALLCEDNLIAGVDYSGTPHKVSYEASTGSRTGEVIASAPGLDMVVHEKHTYVLAKDGVLAIDRQAHIDGLQRITQLDNESKESSQQLNDWRKQRSSLNVEERKNLDRRIDQLTQRIYQIEEQKDRLKNAGLLWDYPGKGFQRLIVAGKTAYIGGEGLVVGVDAETGKETWRERIEGKAAGMAAGEGFLVVSSDAGPVYCFSESPKQRPKKIAAAIEDNSYDGAPDSALYRQAVEKILSECPARKGYCLVLDCGEGQLAYELAKRTEFQIIGLESDPQKRSAAQKKMLSAGLLGKRVVIEPWDIETLPDYFANLIVSDGMLIHGKTGASEEQRFRVLRPWGGVSLLSFHQDDVLSWKKIVRGALEGSGQWTHQYSDPQNTACSGDPYVDNPLGILWYGEPGPSGMVERHARAQSPVAMNGIVYMEGEEIITAVDAYNGTLLWKRSIPGAVRVKTKADSGNLVITENGLYVAAFDKCHRLDPETGETIRVYTMPVSEDGSPRRWGYLSVIGGILYGSTAESMIEEYGDILDILLLNGQWRDLEDIPNEKKERYLYYRSQYPDAQDFILASQRDGALYKTMTSFGPGGEFMQKNAVTEGLMTSDKIFAVDIDTGRFLWIHDGKGIANISISIGGGKIFLADHAVSEQQKQTAMDERLAMKQAGIYKERDGIKKELAERRKQINDSPDINPRTRSMIEYVITSLETEMFQEEHPEGKLTYDDADIRLVTALDAKTGRRLWEKPVELTGCCGDRMGSAFAKGMLFFFGNHGNHDAWRFSYGGLKWRRITALDADTGSIVWSRPLNYRTRPVIVGDQIILEPQACNLFTGELITRKHPITGEDVPWEFLRPGHTCGITAASANGLFYRSACTAFYDLEEDDGVVLFGGYRPGCAISVIPACGVLLSQEAAAGCTCSYPIRCSFAMMRKPDREKPWTVYVTPGELKPVRHLAVNFGAAADRKDDRNVVWFSYPNPKTDRFNHFPNYGVKFDLGETIQEGLGYYCRDYKNMEKTDKPWLYASGCLGLLRCSIPLLDESMENRRYTVRMGFMPLDDDQVGQRVFDIKLQDKIVAENIDLKKMASPEENAVIQEFRNVDVSQDLVIEFVPKHADARPENAALINWIEIMANDAFLSMKP
ncbi:MAG: PQQ-binding-like beta-propeller repeat protein [Candidatus Omnitrophica bacterium]|nr:PQQ-binding-like beta-propeller repeat protein [Candidatus Omnitrophota bacterium]